MVNHRREVVEVGVSAWALQVTQLHITSFTSFHSTRSEILNGFSWGETTTTRVFGLFEGGGVTYMATKNNASQDSWPTSSLATLNWIGLVFPSICIKPTGVKREYGWESQFSFPFPSLFLLFPSHLIPMRINRVGFDDCWRRDGCVCFGAIRTDVPSLLQFSNLTFENWKGTSTSSKSEWTYLCPFIHSLSSHWNHHVEIILSKWCWCR